MKRILVVDDEVGALALIGIMLDRGGFEVVKAQNAAQALDVLERETPDLIILDIMMPGTDGIELCSIIRGMPRFAETPILILSARSDSDSVIRSMEAGATGYLPKPILHHDLVSKVRSMLNLSAVER
ncbi:MAG: response regulator [Chloroflexi bacterium]|jgi:two-component system response regulator MtrA|nr:response regulator [Chloroflexota bacterium]